MTGYNHDMGMSNNAVWAYEDGLRPLSKITMADLKSADVNITMVFARWLAQQHHWPYSEWHHSGGDYYNRVKFYDPTVLANRIEQGTIDLAALETEFRQSKPTPDECVRVAGRFAVWGGSRARPKIIEHQEFTGSKKGAWIHLDCGGRKKANGKHISYHTIT